MLKVKLSQVGKKGQLSFRIVIAEARGKRDGQYVEKIGFYNPHCQPPKFKIDQKRLKYWLSHGAQMTDSVRKITQNYA